jgi:hypothetical protein
MSFASTLLNQWKRDLHLQAHQCRAAVWARLMDQSGCVWRIDANDNPGDVSVDPLERIERAQRRLCNLVADAIDGSLQDSALKRPALDRRFLIGLKIGQVAGLDLGNAHELIQVRQLDERLL